jgi:hypothetical protein
MTEFDLVDVGLEGAAGGEVVSTLMQNNSNLKLLFFRFNPLGVQGARALQSGIRGNQTVHTLVLQQCQLGDQGVSLVVDAILEGNTKIKILSLHGNHITASGLPHVTRLLRLLRQRDSSLEALDLDNNPGLFDNEENTKRFSTVLSKCTTMTRIRMNLCQLPISAVIALFQASVINKQLLSLYVYDHVQLQGGQDLNHLLKIIPQMQNLRYFCVNLDFHDKAVLSAFHWNTSFLYLLDSNDVEITTGPVNVSLKRNRRLGAANKLLDREPRQEVIPLGLWAEAIERLGDENIGATAVYKIVREKLEGWAPKTLSSTTTGVIASSTAANALPSSNSKRSQALMEYGDEKTDAKSSSSSLVEPQQKRPRHMMMDDIDTTSIDSLSREELMEQNMKMAEQAATIAKIATLVNNNNTERVEMEKEDKKD